MQQAGSAPSLRETPVYGYASVYRRERGTINEELRVQADAIVAECERRRLGLRRVVSEREPDRGKLVVRPGLQYVLKQVAAREAPGLMVCDLSRLTRSADRLGAILEWFVRHDLRLVSIAEGIDTAEPGGLASARALIDVSKRERRLVIARARRDLPVPRRNSRPPRRPAVTDDPELRQRILRMREQQMSLRAIADRLNAEGVPTVRGGAKWRPSSLQAAIGYGPRRPELAALLGDQEPGSAGGRAVGLREAG